MITIRRIIPRDLSILLSQGPHEPNQLISNKSKKVPERASTCFSQVAYLLISCICYNSKGVDLGIAEGICYGIDCFFSQVI